MQDEKILCLCTSNGSIKHTWTLDSIYREVAIEQRTIGAPRSEAYDSVVEARFVRTRCLKVAGMCHRATDGSEIFICVQRTLRDT